MHLHGTGRRKRAGSTWVGSLAAGAMLVVVAAAVANTGWIALAPFGFAALIVIALLWLMRATERSAK